MDYKKIIMTGGGSAGHVTPNIALMPELKKIGYEIQYIGTEDGIERKIIEKENIKYHAISSGKLRRYFDIKNFTDPFKVIKGVYQSYEIIKREKPNVVFSKGGFVSVPVVMGAYFNKVPVIIHESDMTPGLANKLSLPFCTKACVTFPESINHIKEGKAVLTGIPIRKEFAEGSKIKGLKMCGFTGQKTVLLVIGGSLGSKFINETVRGILKELCKMYDIIHVCGKGNIDESLSIINGYKQFEYISDEIPDIMAAADMVISRAGANTIFELLTLKKPNILIPLTRKSSRGDQILNSHSFEKNGYSIVIEEENLTKEKLLDNLKILYNNKNKYIENMSKSKLNNAVSEIINIIKKYSK